MLRIIRRFFAAGHPSPQPNTVAPQINETQPTTLVYVRVKPEKKTESESASAPTARIEAAWPEPPPASLPVQAVRSTAVAVPAAAAAGKPRRRKSRKATSGNSLASLGIFSARQIKSLHQIGCRTVRQLQRLTPARLEKRLVDHLAAQQHSPAAPLAPPVDRIRSLVRRGRWAIRFANQFDDMTPRESLLLRAVHRGSRQTLSRDSAGMIRRDLQRLALSSRGKRLVTLDEIPDLQRVKNWITTASDGRSAKSPAPSDQRPFRFQAIPEDSLPDVPMVAR